MPNVAVLVMGPAGAGKVTPCGLTPLTFVDDVLYGAYGHYCRTETTRVVRKPRPRCRRLHLGTHYRFGLCLSTH